MAPKTSAERTAKFRLKKQEENGYDSEEESKPG